MLNILEMIERGYKPDAPILLTGPSDVNSNVAKQVAESITDEENTFVVELSNKNPNDEFDELLNAYGNAVKLANEGEQVVVIVNIVGTEPPLGYTQIKLTSIIEGNSFYLENELIKLDSEKEQNLFSVITKPKEMTLESVLDNRLVHFDVSDEQYSVGDTHKLK